MTALQRERDFLWAAVAVFGISLPLSLALGFLLGRKLTGPIKALTHGAERIARGDLDYTVTPHGNNEIGELAQAFNTMTGKLSRSLESLKKKIYPGANPRCDGRNARPFCNAFMLN